MITQKLSMTQKLSITKNLLITEKLSITKVIDNRKTIVDNFGCFLHKVTEGMKVLMIFH